MSPEQKRKFNTATGTGFLLSGLVAWGLAAYFAVTPNPPKPAPVSNTATVDLQSCVRALQRMGYPEASVRGADVVAYEPISADPKAQLERATMAALICKLETKSFCMGESCSRPGVTLVSALPASTKETVEAALPKPPTEGLPIKAPSPPTNVTQP